MNGWKKIEKTRETFINQLRVWEKIFETPMVVVMGAHST
jgi:hypothetical protein